ncbi:DUF881 domain-containing protein [Pseudokineococcus lusitanus]|uniref:Uncharacterized protein YlxW (UPF0749 family) n=1 Tax=Pseudokineococcus lusitanus TaxID=763993 RepID=A0A3N1HT63_9ACTN|nr:DUF881 domain-containing protein [Pseudokineococcus lusitanus]ROP45610.1 uncharacterized protein YlxW (UPF0749 family) [Pseudokineococcus lusitanus]
MADETSPRPRHARPGEPDRPAVERPDDGAGEPGTSTPPGAPRRHDGTSPWRRLATALLPRATRGQVLAGLLCLALGFALVVQLRSTQESGLGQLREADLVRAVDDLGDQRQRLQSELAELEQSRRALESEGASRAEALASARERERSLALLAGTEPAVGPGVELRVDEASDVMARDVLGAVQELRDAGAEVISVGDVRVVASSAFVDADGTVEVDGTALGPSFSVLAIGDPSRLEATAGIPGGVLDLLENRGAAVTVRASQEVRVDALAELPEDGVARRDDAPSDGG